MSDTSQSSALRQLRTSFNPLRREIQTIELKQSRLDVSDKLDLVFCMDTTGSMEASLEAIADSLSGVASGIADEFPSVRYSVISFKDEDQTSIVTSPAFTTLAACQTALDGLTASGGGDLEENGYGALYMASRLPWRDEAARVVILISDVGSHERGRSYESTKTSLLVNSVVMFDGIDLVDSHYTALVNSTGGVLLTSGTVEELTAQIVDNLKSIANPVQDPIFLVNDTQPFTANLETGEEIDFANRSFALNPFNSGEDGALSISLTIDNTDFAVSRYLAVARKFPLPLEVILRVYFNDDTSEPQNIPISLFATDFETKGTTVSCQVRYLDLQNSPFPNAFYTSQRCPSLQG